jgi:flagellar hook-associated protein 1 FlgK
VSGGDLLGISTSGLVASQRALSTVGHNIANASTPGYSRQRVDLEARPPQIASNGAIGTGVAVENVSRVYNEFLVSQVRDTTSLSHYLDKSYEYTSQVDNMLADPQGGLAPALSNYFDAVNGVANNPSAIAAREVMLGASRNLSDRFAYLNNRFESMREAGNTDIRAIVEEVNHTAHAIAEVNKAIIRAKEFSNSSPNDLLDRRDTLVKDLSEKINVRVTLQDDGRMNVFVGNGQTLVVGDDASALDVMPNDQDPTRLEVLFVGHGSNLVITQFLSGGALGGIAKFRNEVLDPAQNELGRIAVGVAKTVNEQHRLGMDLNNNLGGNYFTELNKVAPQVLPSIHNQGDTQVGLEITDAGKLTVSNYQLLFQKGEYELLRLDDSKVVAKFKDFPQDIETDGIRLHLASGSTIKENDRFLLQPTRRAADLFKLEIGANNKIAAASPVRAEADIDNLGDAKIEVTNITDTANSAFTTSTGELSPPYVVRFVDDSHFELLDNTGKPVKVKLDAKADAPEISLHDRGNNAAATAESTHADKENGRDSVRANQEKSAEKHGRDENNRKAGDIPAVAEAIAYDPQKGVQVLPTPGGISQGMSIRIDGTPKAGDIFRIEYNNDATSDNKNALALAQLQTKAVLMGNKSDYAQTYGELVSRIGSKTHELEVNKQAQKLLLNQAEEEQQNASGVNLDEEAADMIRFQNQYKANAQVVATTNNVFDVLMGAFRR